MTLLNFYQTFLSKSQNLSGLPPLLFRLILAPIMIIAGYSKLGLSENPETFLQAISALPSIVSWFGNAEWGLGLPFPSLLAFLAAWTEFLGGWLLFLGLFTRIVSIPLAFTMFVAITTVHLENGWFSVTPTNSETSAAKVLDWLNVPGAKASLENSKQASERLNKMREILEENGYTEYLYETGKPVILNNGIEFGFIYFAMLLSLFFTGGGRFFSLDYWLSQRFFTQNHVK
ncbi:HvfX family Cu-binding RiPP maturation protein [Pseudoalteromonas sp. G4]|uniref:HvfX family Cu-binding RiPP maturation protein n=1 Tax=Pseudoalteromonas sp. G4 TaxID=2992761 RepID=UPI00237DBF53|nr:DoxX family protein [Pseudoalteromonas sp. G4]MDE3273865.1 DoxX family protein [Pseudoalteromonas sp. G4]